MSERAVEDYLTKVVEDELHGWCIKLSPRFIWGLPDRLVLLPKGRVWFIELKYRGARGVLSSRQRRRRDRLRGLGMNYTVLDDRQAIDHWRHVHREVGT